MSFCLPTTLTLANANSCADALAKAVLQGECSIDAAALTHCDSSAVAVLLKARRIDKTKPLQILNPPAMLLSLVTLYGANELLGMPRAVDLAVHLHKH